MDLETIFLRRMDTGAMIIKVMGMTKGAPLDQSAFHYCASAEMGTKTYWEGMNGLQYLGLGNDVLFLRLWHTGWRSVRKSMLLRD